MRQREAAFSFYASDAARARELISGVGNGLLD